MECKIIEGNPREIKDQIDKMLSDGIEVKQLVATTTRATYIVFYECGKES